jgi:hypothetical protein
MQINNWKEIWNNTGGINNSIMFTLLKADGYDIPWGRIEAEDWIQCNFFKIVNQETDKLIDNI